MSWKCFLFHIAFTSLNVFSVKRIGAACKRIFCIMCALCIMNENRICMNRLSSWEARNEGGKYLLLFSTHFHRHNQEMCQGLPCVCALCYSCNPFMAKGGKHQLNICDRWYSFRCERLNTVEIIKFINKTFAFLKMISQRVFFSPTFCWARVEKIWFFQRAIFTLCEPGAKRSLSGKLHKDAIKLCAASTREFNKTGNENFISIS